MLRELLVSVLLVGLVSGQGIGDVCPPINDLSLPEGSFLQQEVRECPLGLYGNMFYTCYNNQWVLMNECRCRFEIDEYGFTWWGVKVNRTESYVTPTGTVKRICLGNGWGSYDGSEASKCPGFDEYPPTPRGDTINICKGEGESNIFCNYAGIWKDVGGICFCPEYNGWNKTIENSIQLRACGMNIETRSCDTGGVWGFTHNEYCSCPSIPFFDSVPYEKWNEDNVCNNGVRVYRYCDADGHWEDPVYDGTCKCIDESGMEGYVGDHHIVTCESGRIDHLCTEVGEWMVIESSCSCPKEYPWMQAEVDTTHEVICENGGRLRRTCNADGYWDDVEIFNCKCPAEGIWSETEAGSYGIAGCSNGYIIRYCGPDGTWTEEYDNSSCMCAPDSDWVLTAADSTAVMSCPSGEKTRYCNKEGTWENVNYDNCMCEAIDGFEATPIGMTAIAFCFDADGVPDEDYIQYRNCGENGEWGALDQNQCPVKWCPSEQSWYKVPVGNQATLVTMGCMYGYRTRTCNVNGAWSDVDTEHCQCEYFQEFFRQVNPGESYSIPCDIGNQVYTCNANSGYFDPVDVSTCKCQGDSQFSTTDAGAMASALCSEGVATRICSINGHWDAVDNGNCMCRGDGVWEVTYAGSNQAITCDKGLRVRRCLTQGFWDYPLSSCWCEANGRSAEQGTASITACEEGSIIYSCGEDGHFQAPDSSSCYCASRIEYGHIWNRINAGELSSSLTCMNGNVIQRQCNIETGHWDDVDKDACRCTTDDIWDSVGIGEYAYADCPAHSTGIRRRMCNGDSWGEIDETACYKECFYDRGNGISGYIAVDKSLILPCYTNFEGTIRLTCVYDEETNESKLEYVQSKCNRLTCIGEDPMYPIDAGKSEVVKCDEGYTGNRTHTCQSNGTWSSYDETNCVIRVCPATRMEDIEFPATNAGTNSTVDCQEGYAGTRKLFCTYEGVWDTKVVAECTRNVCHAEGNWPETNSLEYATIACPSEYRGNWKRLCQADGTWEEAIIPSTCIPIPPVLKAMPYNNMKYVSRSPSVNLFSSYSIAKPFVTNGCPGIQVASIEDPTHVYQLTLNTQKMAMVGQYKNGGVYSDFIPSAPYDVDSYLRYGEYKATIPSCWKAYNGASVPPRNIEIKFHTVAIPPSAPTNIRFIFEAEQFYIKYEAPEFVDEPYPVTAYHISFQPPFYPEGTNSKDEFTFGPYKYIEESMSILMSAENAYGLSSPDESLEYDFEDIYKSVPAFAVSLPAPVIELVHQYIEGSYVTVTARVSNDISKRFIYSHTVLMCNGDEIPLESPRPVEYSVSVPKSLPETSIECMYKLKGTYGDNSTLVVPIVISEFAFGPVKNLVAYEKASELYHFSWNAPIDYTPSGLDYYILECQKADETEYTISYNVTHTSIDIPLFRKGISSAICRIAAHPAANIANPLNYVYVNIDELHPVSEEDIVYSYIADATTITVYANAPFCVHGYVMLENDLGRYEGDLECNKETNVMSYVFQKLEPETSYDILIAISNPSFYKYINAETAKPTPVAITGEIMDHLITSASAVLKITLDSPDYVYCIASDRSINTNYLVSRMKAGGVDKDSLYIGKDEFEYYVFSSLKPSTTYNVGCVTRYALSTTVIKNAFTTPIDSSTISIINVMTIVEESAYSTLVLSFDSPVEANPAASLSITCGGAPLSHPINRNDLVHTGYEYRISLYPYKNSIVPGSRCSISFPRLDAFMAINDAGHASQLNPKPFVNKEGERSEFFIHTIHEDAQGPILQPIATIFGSFVSIFSITEPLLVPREETTYSIDCTYKGESTVHHVYSMSGSNIAYDLFIDDSIYQVYIRVGSLPHLHTCTLSFLKSSMYDKYGNKVTCSSSTNGRLCSYTFVNRVYNPDKRQVYLSYVSPENAAADVSIDQEYVAVFDREVTAVKPVTFRCSNCKKEIVTILPSCDGMKCVMKNEAKWEMNKTYYVYFDSYTFKAKWEDYYYIPSKPVLSFTTTMGECNMEYIAQDWNKECNCLNVGTMCQCDCGKSSILEAMI